MKSFFIFVLLGSLALPLMTQASDSQVLTAEGKAKLVEKEINDLVKYGGKYVYMNVAKSNGFSPFAVGRQADGSIVMLEVPKSDDHVSLQQKVLKLRQMLKMAADNGKFVASALFAQAKVPHKGQEVDGVAIEMEHKFGISVLRFTPYEVDRENQKVKFKNSVDKAKPSVFYKDVLALAAEESKQK